MIFDPTPIQFNKFVYHDRPYRHPQLGSEVGRDFFDRLWERSQAWQALTDPIEPRSVVIVAERRMGKTSLLRYLVEQLKKQPGFVPALLPIGGSLHSADDLFSEIADHTWAALEQSSDDLTANLDGLTVEAQIALLRQLCAVAPGVTVVLCLDELDACLEHQETPDAEARKIAALVNALAAQEDLPIRLLCTTIRPPDQVADGCLAPLLRRAAQFRLAPFARGDSDEMLVELAAAHLGLRLTDDDLTAFYRQSGGWPFFAKLLLVCLGETEPGDNRPARALDLAARHTALTEALEHIFRNYFDRNEKALVIALVEGHGRLSATQIARLGPAAAAAANRLAERSFLQIEADGSLSFRIGLLAKWFPLWSKYAEMAEAYCARG